MRQTLPTTTARRKIHQPPKRTLGRSVFPLANDVLLRVRHGPLPLQGELTDWQGLAQELTATPLNTAGQSAIPSKQRGQSLGGGVAGTEECPQ